MKPLIDDGHVASSHAQHDTQHNPILIDDDDDPSDQDLVLIEDPAIILQTRSTRHESVVIDSASWVKLPQKRIGDFCLRPGQTFRLKDCHDYLQISDILSKRLDRKHIIVRGLRFRPLRHIFAGFEGSLHDVAMVQERFTDSKVDSNGRVLETFILSQISTTRVPLYFTNLPWNMENRHENNDTTGLVCRSVYTSKFLSPARQKAPKQDAIELRNLTEEEVRQAKGINNRPMSDYSLRLARRIAQSDAKEKGRRSKIERRSVYAQNSNACSRNLQAKLRFCDGFAGMGAVTAAAKVAGLEPVVSFDHNEAVLEVYAKNHKGVHCLAKSFFTFVTRYAHLFRIDVLHLSPPCQFFSPAHTVAGKTDEANEAANLGIGACLRAMRPRVLLMEQTSGLKSTKGFRNHLMTVVASIQHEGYSVKYKVQNLAALGNPAPRKRLIIIAAA